MYGESSSRSWSKWHLRPIFFLILETKLDHLESRPLSNSVPGVQVGKKCLDTSHNGLQIIFPNATHFVIFSLIFLHAKGGNSCIFHVTSSHEWHQQYSKPNFILLLTGGQERPLSFCQTPHDGECQKQLPNGPVPLSEIVFQVVQGSCEHLSKVKN